MTCLRPRVYAVLFTGLLCAVPLAARLAAQGTGTLSGTVVDAQGGALPGATVTVTEQATNAARTITSDPDGRVPHPGPSAGAVQPRNHHGRVLAAQGDGHPARAG